MQKKRKRLIRRKSGQQGVSKPEEATDQKNSNSVSHALRDAAKRLSGQIGKEPNGNVVKEDVEAEVGKEPIDQAEDGRVFISATKSGSGGDDLDVDEIEDQLEQTVTKHRAEAVDNEPEFSPLENKLPPATDFPDDVLDGLLLRFAVALETLTGAPFAMCAVALLGFVNLAVQGLADIGFIGSAKPISTNTLIIGSSGERKSTLFGYLSKPIADFESSMERAIEQEAMVCTNDVIGEPPLLPNMIYSEATPAGLYYILTRCLGRMGLFSDEAGIFLGGHGLRRETHLALLSQLSSLYDAKPVTIVRRSEGVIRVEAKRLAVLLFGQWFVVNDFLTDPLNRGQGFISRFLCCYPTSRIGKRKCILRPGAAVDTLREYEEWMTNILNKPLSVAKGTRNYLSPPVLALTEQAEELFVAYHDEVESQMGELGPEHPLLNVLNKYPQHSLRLAATLQLAEEPDSRELDGGNVERGILLARYFMSEMIRLSSPANNDEHLEASKALLDALKKKGLREFDRAWCYSNGPHSLRRKKALMPVLDLLLDSGWLVEVSMPKRQGVAKTRTVYRLTRAALLELGIGPV